MRKIVNKIILTIVSFFWLTNIFGQAENTKLKIARLSGDFYVYTTYH